MLPFTRDQFLGVFSDYNHAIWPMQIVAYALGLLALLVIFRGGQRAGLVISAILGAMWLWTGIAYHGLFFSAINPAAMLFAALFAVQGLALIWLGGVARPMRFGFDSGVAPMVGLALILYAMAIYPLIGSMTGHSYPAMPMFGVTPCPVTLFTFGILLLAPKSPVWLLVIPVLWSLVGGSAAVLLSVPQDWVLLVSGVVSLALIYRTRHLAGA